MSTKIIPVSALRRQTSAVLRRIQEDGDIVYITPAILNLEMS